MWVQGENYRIGKMLETPFCATPVVQNEFFEKQMQDSRQTVALYRRQTNIPISS